MLAGQLALIAAALFAGAAIYVSLVEQPARLLLPEPAMLAEWKPAYKRGTAMQAPLAIVGFLLGLVAFWRTGAVLWAVGALVLVLNWPYTLLAIMPTNRLLTAIVPADAGQEARTLIQRWGTLHAGRSALGAAATAIFLWASLQ